VTWHARRFAIAILLSAASAACGTAQHAHHGAATPVAAGPKPAAAPPSFTKADVEFMQGMIGHHTQAIEMVKLLKSRTTRDDMKLLGLRIEVSQADEIKMMRTWLADRQESVPGDSDYRMMMSMPGHAMPGMLTQKEMDQLAAAKGAEFDRLFLEYMIKHHEGALTMVERLMAEPGAGQESSIFAFASDVTADQSTEIKRMRAMRATMGK
jgi:uncharacterized protein (DUF305 family)